MFNLSSWCFWHRKALGVRYSYIYRKDREDEPFFDCHVKAAEVVMENRTEYIPFLTV